MTDRAMVGDGSAGDDVTALQQGLASLGFDPGTVDGIFGGQTAAALRAFQESKGLAADGVAGPDTWAAFEATLAPPPAAEPVVEVAPAAAPEPAVEAAPEAPAPKLTETASAIADATGVTVSDAPSSDPSGIRGVMDALKDLETPATDGNLGVL